jgi:hypothetical protein
MIESDSESQLLTPGKTGPEDYHIFCNYCPAFCCYRLPGSTLLLTAIDINRLARHFAISDGEIRKRYIEGRNTFKVREDGSCVFLANGRFNKRCTVHTARPQQCRDFPYNRPCPYLSREDLLAAIAPRVAKSLGCAGEE